MLDYKCTSVQPAPTTHSQKNRIQTFSDSSLTKKINITNNFDSLQLLLEVMCELVLMLMYFWCLDSASLGVYR